MAIKKMVTDVDLDAAVQAEINDTGSLSRGALNATYVGNTPSGFDRGKAIRDTAYRPFQAQLLAGGSQVFIHGHSVVNFIGASVPAKGFANLVKNGIRAVDPTATVSISGTSSATTTVLLAAFDGATANQNATYTSLTVFMGLLNDYHYGVDPALTQANLAALVAKMKFIQPLNKPTPGYLILIEWLRGDTTSPAYPWPSYVAAAKAVADADTSVTVLDLGARMGQADTANLNGFYSADKAHPVDKGHLYIANAVLTEILPLSGVTNPPDRSRVSLLQVDPKAGPATVNVGTWALSVNANYIGNGVYYNSSNALNDETNYDIVLAPGTWSFDFTLSKNTNGAIVTVSLDDGYGTFTTLGTIDTYNGSALYNQVITISGNVLAGTIPLRRRLKIAVTGRNASNTTGYYLNLQYIQARRTA